MDEYFFTLNCSLQSPVDPIADFQFYITQNFTGDFDTLANFSEDTTTNINAISETSWSITVILSGSFAFPETDIIQVNCIVSNPHGNDGVATSVRLCGKHTLNLSESHVHLHHKTYCTTSTFI